jgi:hypothetical protein
LVVIRARSAFAAVAGALALALAAAAPAPAPVPPKDCGTLRASGERFTIKADQVRCRDARSYARAYLRRSVAPSGFRCRDYGPETRIEFRCNKGQRVFFAIRR